MDLHTRLLRSFIVLAEELHFTRAAARLYVTQQALSSHIQQLETAVGVRLVSRSTRRVELTPAGERLLETAAETITMLDAASDELRTRYASPAASLSVGFLAFAALELTAPILQRFREVRPDVTVSLREFPWNDVTCGLATGATDVAFLRQPVSMPGLRSETLFVEPRAITLPVGHPLADRHSIGVDEVLDIGIFAPDTQDAMWRSFWLLEPYRGGQPAPIALERTASLVSELEAVAAGQGAMITAGALRRYTPHPHVRYVLLDEDVGSELSVAYRLDRSNEAIETFVRCALEVRDAEPDLVAMIEGSHSGRS